MGLKLYNCDGTGEVTDSYMLCLFDCVGACGESLAKQGHTSLKDLLTKVKASSILNVNLCIDLKSHPTDPVTDAKGKPVKDKKGKPEVTPRGGDTDADKDKNNRLTGGSKVTVYLANLAPEETKNGGSNTLVHELYHASQNAEDAVGNNGKRSRTVDEMETEAYAYEYIWLEDCDCVHCDHLLPSDYPIPPYTWMGASPLESSLMHTLPTSR